MKRAHIIIVFVSALYFIKCAHSNKSPVEEIKTAEWRSLNKEGFGIRYPAEWIVDTSGQMGSSFFLFSKKTDENDKFRENVNLIVQDLSGNDLTLEKFAEITEDQIKALVVNPKILSSDRVGEGRDSYHKVVYLGTQGVFELRFDQYLWLIDDVSYILTLTTENTEFDKYQTLGYEILNSFELKGQ